MFELPAGVREAVVRRLVTAGCVYADDEAALLIAEADGPQQLDALVRRRESGQPLEQIVGWAEFCGLRLTVAPGVFVPRSRTGLLVTEAVRRCQPGEVVVDLCTGIGAVAATVISRAPGVEVYATDLDPAAVGCARRNLGSRGTVVRGDLFRPLPDRLRGSVAVITANAPYVPTGEIAFMPMEAREHENAIALDGGGDGLDVHRRIIAEAPDWLASGGSLLIESGREQVAADLDLLRAAGFVASAMTDDEIDATVVIGVRPCRHPLAEPS